MGVVENIFEVLLKFEQVEVQIGMKKSYIYCEMEKGIFLFRYKVGGGICWYQSDIQCWICVCRSVLQWMFEDVGWLVVNCDSSGV